jgi:malonyl CoA-acyl carrier protein transacylase/acetyltransferase-like isoleucine patch superfamily enzyme
MEMLTVKGGVHTGMQTYITTSVESWDGVSFHQISIGNDTSCGQRSIILSGTKLGKNVTIGAETCTGHNTRVGDNGTAFGSPLVIFESSTTNARRVSGCQRQARRMIGEPSQSDLTQPQELTTKLPFWLYAVVMNIAQFIMPVIAIGSYVAIYVGCLAVFAGSFGPVGLALMIPTTFILGSILLMLMIKLLQLAFFGGPMITGTIRFYSVQFMGWYFLSDLVFLCTQTVFVPFSGTEIFCHWLRLMGSTIGKEVFFSPENGGLRELDFLTVGDNCHILTPNINSHYADHGVMQFCPVIFSDGCEVNPGATVMPLTEYGEGSTLRPFAVTSKGQFCKAHTQYVGNTAKAVTAESIDTVAILFAGLGSTYVGMFKDVELYPNALAMLHEASEVLNLDILELCTSSTMDDVNVAQMVVTVMNIVSIEIMKQREALLMSQATIVAGFSVGEFAALYFAGAISFKDALNLVRVQCEEFTKLKTRSALCNIRGLLRKDVELLCKRFHCSIANVISDHSRSPDENKRNVFVCGGTTSSIDLIVSYVNGLGTNNAEGLEEGRRSQISAKKLPVKTANRRFLGYIKHHFAFAFVTQTYLTMPCIQISCFTDTMLMMPAVNEFRRVLARTCIQMPRHHLVYSNVTGRPYKSVAEIRKLLPLQMTKPVQWQATIEHIHFKEGCNKFVECGAMRSQSAMVKLILPNHQDLKFYSSDLAGTAPQRTSSAFLMVEKASSFFSRHHGTKHCMC